MSTEGQSTSAPVPMVPATTPSTTTTTTATIATTTPTTSATTVATNDNTNKDSSSGPVAVVAESTQGIDVSGHPSGIVPVIQNIVSTVNLDCQLDLREIAMHARNAEFKPSRFSAVIMRIRDPRTTALIFRTGKMVCTGAKSEDDSKLAARKYARVIMRLGFKVKFKEFKIQNMVGSCDVKFPIRLEGLHYNYQEFSQYEPEMFPGLIYKMLEPKVALLIFVSGKVVITGAKSRQDIYTAFENIYSPLMEFRKT
eukprot:m.35106 g.35106  ORF g.35106 m.35106 type:complete len:254 (-) comp17085_c2_seq1:129-890(-)